MIPTKKRRRSSARSDVGGRRAGPDQRQEAVLAAHEEDHGELQPLGGVEGEEGDPLGPRVPGVHLAAQGQLGQETVEVVPGPDRQRAQQLGGGEEGQVRRVLGQRRGLQEGFDAPPRLFQGLASEGAGIRARTPGLVGQRAMRALLERDAGPAQGLDQRRRLGVGAVEDGHVVEGKPGAVPGNSFPTIDPAAVEREGGGAAQQPLQGVDHQLGLGPLARRLLDDDPRRGAGAHGHQTPVRDEAAGADRLAGRLHHGPRRAVVAGQVDRPALRASPPGSGGRSPRPRRGSGRSTGPDRRWRRGWPPGGARSRIRAYWRGSMSWYSSIEIQRKRSR